MNSGEIKFRAWIGDRMEYQVMAGQLGSYFAHQDPNDNACAINTKYTDSTSIMQYTGLKDKSNKEIYEGDIVSVYDEANLFIVRFGKITRRVISHDGQSDNLLEFNTFYFEAIDNHKPYQSIVKNTYGEHDLNGTTIIGNIFENPELLN